MPVVFLLMLVLVTQSNAYADIAETLLRGLAGAATKGITKSQWDAVKQKASPELYYCVESGLAAHNSSVQALIDQGIAPNDKRLQPITQQCDKFLARTLNKNFNCSLESPQTNRPFATQCDENYAILQNGQWFVIDRNAAIKAHMQNSGVNIKNTETQDAREVRRIATEKEQRERDAERARIAEDQERIRRVMEEELRQQQSAQAAERMRQTEAARNAAAQQAAEKASADRFAAEKAARANESNDSDRSSSPEAESPKKSTPMKVRSSMDL